MKKLKTLLTILLMLIVLCSAVHAEGILPQLSTTPTTGETIISYSMEFRVAPDRTTTSADGSMTLTFENVYQEQYRQFSVLLGERGYEVTGNQSTTALVDVTLTGEGGSFRLRYDPEKSCMTFDYPTGLVPELYVDNPFADAIEVQMGQTFTERGQGQVKLLSLEYSPDSLADYYAYKVDSVTDVVKRGECHLLLHFSFRNDDEDKVSAAKTAMANVKLHYVTSDRHETYPLSIASFTPARSRSAAKADVIHTSQEPQTEGEFVATSKTIPEEKLHEMFEGTEGIVALTFNLLPKYEKTYEASTVVWGMSHVNITLLPEEEQTTYVYYVRP